jgi:hypothetical protein
MLMCDVYIAVQLHKREHITVFDKFPELQVKYTEENWDVMAGVFHRRVIAEEKEHLNANKENVTVQDLWAHSKMKRDCCGGAPEYLARTYRRAVPRVPHRAI